MQHSVWYTKVKQSFKQRLKQRYKWSAASSINPKKQQQSKQGQAENLLLALPLLWLSIATLFLLFVCWLSLWVRLPSLHKQVPYANQVLNKDDITNRVSHHLNDIKPLSLQEIPNQSLLQVARPAFTRLQQSPLDTSAMSAKWGISVHPIQTTLDDNQVFKAASMLVDEKTDCMDIEICELGNTIDNSSDVVMADAEE